MPARKPTTHSPEQFVEKLLDVFGVAADLESIAVLYFQLVGFDGDAVYKWLNGKIKSVLFAVHVS